MDNNWSIEAIKERAANNWSLEGDNQLLNLMKSISKNVEQRCMTSNNNLNRLMLDVDKTKIKLGNATTKLLDLNNGKFVEHTVMDMESSLSNAEKCSTSENDKSFLPLPKAVEEAVTNGLNMMDRCYEKVLLNLEDSDEDENESGQKQVVCRPKNPYLNRPLPHLIGSKQWNEKWHVGLIESDEEVLSDDEPEEFSQSSSEDESLSISPQTSNAPTTSESDFAVPTSAVIPQNDLFHRFPDDIEEKSPLFADDDDKQREKVKVQPAIVPSSRNESRNESPNKSKQLTEPSVPSSDQPKQTIFIQPKPEQKFLNLFDDEPPTLDEPIRNERKPVNLFLDSDEDDDVVPTAKKPSSIFNNNNVNRPTIPFVIPQMDNATKEDKSKNAFHGDVDNNNTSVAARSKTKPTLKSNDFGGLFDDDEPPDDFFDIIVRDKSPKVDKKEPEKPKLQTKTVNLFDSDGDEDDDFSRIIGTTKKNDSKVQAATLSAKEKIVVKDESAKSIPAIEKIEKSNVIHSPYSSPFKPYHNPGPPKSYVSFLDDESPSFDDDKKPNESILSQQPVPESLFDDLPPDDIIVPPVALPVTKNRKSTAKIIYDDINETLQENSAPPPTTSSKSLFDENPPDDIIVPPVALPRTSQSKVHHDGIGDALKSKSTISDENSIPISKNEAKTDNDRSQDETDQSLSFKKNLSIFSNPDVNKLPAVEKESKPKPNKLKTNFNINVAALLPGAKLPSQKQLLTAKQDRIDDAEPEKNQNESFENTAPSVQTSSANLDDKSGRLTCLSKSRAKIQVQRKPSTRIGRQSLYNKSLEADNEDKISSIETTDSGSTKLETAEDTPEQIMPKEVSTKSSTPESVVPSENIPEEEVEDVDWLGKSETHDQPPPLESSNLNADEDEEDWLKNIDEKPPSPSKTNLDEEDDWLSAKVVPSEPNPQTRNLSHVMNYDWLTASSLPPEDINPPSNYSMDEDHEQDDWLSSYASKEKSSIVADLPNHEDDWLISSETRTMSSEVGSTVTKAKEEEEDWLLKSDTKNNVKLDENNDDWFTSSFPTASTSVIDKAARPNDVGYGPTDPEIVSKGPDTSETKAEIQKAIKSNLFDSDDDNVGDMQRSSKINFSGETSNISESKTETKNFVNSTLFDDDIDVVPPLTTSSINFGKTTVRDVDVHKQSPPKLDIGGETSNIFKPKIETKTSRKSKLFDDEEDDDDDLFTSTSQQKPAAKQIISTKSEVVKTTKNVSITATAKSLFSDDDNSDSDDLFGATKSIKKTNEKIESGKKVKIDKTTKSGLFDDEDDDDDDIFSSKTQKQRVTQTDSKKKPSTTKSVATIPASNDPLADLLK